MSWMVLDELYESVVYCFVDGLFDDECVFGLFVEWLVMMVVVFWVNVFG